MTDDQLRDCVDNSEIAAGIDQDAAAAHKLGAKGTPALLVNDQFIAGTPGFDQLASMIRNAAGRQPGR